MRSSFVLALAVALVPAAGCSLILDTGDLPTAPADAVDGPVVPDGTPVDAPPDSNPDLLTLDGIDPAVIDEGVGAAQGRPGVLVIEGTSILGSATFTLIPDDPRVHLGAWVVSPEGTLAATTIAVDVDDMLDPGETIALEIEVHQGIDTTARVPFTVRGLPEWITAAAGSQATSSLAPLYSRVKIAHATTLTGDADHPALIRATGPIEITAALSASAVNADAGPGGCDGGTSTVAAGCQGGGGAVGGFSGINAGGGGGGGFAGPGGPGAGDGHGNGGFPTGGLEVGGLIVAPGAAGNRGNGGGGSGGGGVGGGGGGTIVLDAGGTISVTGAGLSANGGLGGASGLCIQVAGALGKGGGGGGSGGAIVVRSRAAIDVSPSAWIAVLPGPGGPSTGGCGGGLGSPGKVRIEAPGDVFGSWTLAALFRGPAWRDPAPIVREPSVDLTLTGRIGQTFPVLLEQAPALDASIFDPSAAVTVTIGGLVRGHNRVCAKVSAGTALTDAYDVTCTDVVYVPE